MSEVKNLSTQVREDMDRAADALLSQHSAVDSVMVVVTWKLPETSTTGLPVMTFRTRQMGNVQYDQLEAMMTQTRAAMGFLVSAVVNWCRELVKSSQPVQLADKMPDKLPG